MAQLAGAVKTAVFTGGGSAGHVLPALPIMRALKERGFAASYIGSGAEWRYLEGEDVPYFAIASGKLRRYFSWRNLWDLFRILGGLMQSYRLLGRIRPAVVFSKGGYVSLPVVLAGWLRRLPVVAHESDCSPGLANRLAMPFLAALCTSFPMTRPKGLRGELLHTGSPVRPELLAGSAQRGRALLNAPPGQPVVLVTGGSLGAQFLNALVRSAAERLTEHCCLVHVCGPGKRTDLQRPGYHQFEYVGAGWGDLLAAADLVVSRAGANSLFELLTLGKPNLLIPLPRAASRGDQIENAAYAAGAGYSRVLRQEALDADRLVDAVAEMLAERVRWRQRLAKFKAPPALDLVVEALLRAARATKA